MARLQILELPEGANDERAPFVLVVDEYEPRRYVMGLDQTEQPVDEFDGVAEKTGARCVLVFAETVDIPANDITIPTDEAFKGEVQEWAAGTNKTLAHIIDAVSGKRSRPANEGQRLADERTDIARDMDRLAKWKNELLDALGMERTRGWDDIRNAAARLRKQRDAQAAELEQLRAGEEPGWSHNIVPTPGQWIARWNQVTPEKRLIMAAEILEGMKRSSECRMEDHEGRIAQLRAQAARSADA
ncbi:hypothetical protein ACIBAC_11655 [Streptomyces sp. NPDC051362]|uniref:hypothetical protein n=1 Tax=Streptomyces sp. NPDC051362 TaxID=3365651 RepID=UPI0037A8C811